LANTGASSPAADGVILFNRSFPTELEY
jgi:hypothetical protein